MTLRDSRRLDNGDTPESPSRDTEPRSRLNFWSNFDPKVKLSLTLPISTFNALERHVRRSDGKARKRSMTEFVREAIAEKLGRDR